MGQNSLQLHEAKTTGQLFSGRGFRQNLVQLRWATSFHNIERNTLKCVEAMVLSCSGERGWEGGFACEGRHERWLGGEIR